MGLIIAVAVILLSLLLFAMGVIAWGALRDDIYYPVKLDFPDEAARRDAALTVHMASGPAAGKAPASSARPANEESDVRRRSATGRRR